MTTTNKITEYFHTALPPEWFSAPPAVTVDDDEILVVGTLPDGSAVDSFREESRAQRVQIAQEAESQFHRAVSWGVTLGGQTSLFTTYNAPVATRLRLSERAVLDTLVESGVARSRSDALSWCVKMVAKHQAEWLDDLRSALVDVERVRAEGPTVL